MAGHRVGSGGNAPTQLARLVSKHGVRVPRRTVVGEGPDVGWTTWPLLSCGHTAGTWRGLGEKGAPALGKKTSCYSCQGEIARRLEEEEKART